MIRRKPPASKPSTPASPLKTPPEPADLLVAIRQFKEALANVFSPADKPHLLFLPLTPAALDRIRQRVDAGLLDAAVPPAVKLQLQELQGLLWHCYPAPDQDPIYKKYTTTMNLVQTIEDGLADGWHGYEPPPLIKLDRGLIDALAKSRVTLTQCELSELVGRDRKYVGLRVTRLCDLGLAVRYGSRGGYALTAKGRKIAEKK